MRIFFDENFSPYFSKGLSIIQNGRKDEGVEVLNVQDHFGRGTTDDVWIPEIAKMHGVVVTQDISINRTKYLYQLCQKLALGVFFMRPPKKASYTYWQWVNIVLQHWDSIKRLSKDTTPPFSFVVNPRSSRPEPMR